MSHREEEWSIFCDWLDPRRRPDAPEMPQPLAVTQLGERRDEQRIIEL